MNYNNNYLFLNHLGSKLTDRGVRLIINEIISYYNRYGTISEADFYSYLIDKKELIDVLKKGVDFDSVLSIKLLYDNKEFKLPSDKLMFNQSFAIIGHCKYIN